MHKSERHTHDSECIGKTLWGVYMPRWLVWVKVTLHLAFLQSHRITRRHARTPKNYCSNRLSQLEYAWNPTQRGGPGASWRSHTILLRRAVGLLRLHQAGAVLVQDPERRVVLERCEHREAGTFPVMQEPNNCRDSNDSHHGEDDHGGQQCARSLRGTRNNVWGRSPLGKTRKHWGMSEERVDLLGLASSASEEKKKKTRIVRHVEHNTSHISWSHTSEKSLLQTDGPTLNIKQLFNRSTRHFGPDC